MKVGDYVRTKHGYIGIYTEKEEIERVPDWNGGWKDEKILYQLINGSRFFEDKIIKSSPNIIDLIEVGDYVNGYKVTMLEDKYYDNVTDSVKKIKDKEKIKIILGNEEQFYGVYAKDIKSIVTKEQFKSMEYKVGK